MEGSEERPACELLFRLLLHTYVRTYVLHAVLTGQQLTLHAHRRTTHTYNIPSRPNTYITTPINTTVGVFG